LIDSYLLNLIYSFDVSVYKDLYRMEVFKVIREFRDDPRHAKETNHILFGTTTYYLVPVPTGSQACGAGIVLHKKPVLRICIWYIVRKTVLWIRNIFLSPNPDPIFL
jgi:hypothetical protein